MRNYCTQNNGDCTTCSLVNYGRDCHNNSIMISLREWASENGRTEISARQLIARGRLPEAEKIGRNWAIPSGTPWPEDRRRKNEQ